MFFFGGFSKLLSVDVTAKINNDFDLPRISQWIVETFGNDHSYELMSRLKVSSLEGIPSPINVTVNAKKSLSSRITLQL